MTTKQTKTDLPLRKKLIEVALPLEAINRESAREKSIRHGHPSTLHLWWARRPLAACRAVLFASLVDDPSSDPAYRNADGSVDEERAGEKRAELFNLIEELVKWENSNNPKVINAARAEIARCVASRKIETGELVKDTPITLHLPEPEWTGKPPRELTAKPWDFVIRRAKPEQVDAFLLEHAPPVLDPFCGGGSIPLEAQRLGLRAYGSDLNPVPVLITKALIEIPPKFAGMPPVHPDALAAGPGGSGKKKSSKGQSSLSNAKWSGAQGLAADVRAFGDQMRDLAKEHVAGLYPDVLITPEITQDREDLEPYAGQSLTPIAWIWARTVPSPDPAMNGAATPLLSTCHLSTVPGKEVWLRVTKDGRSLAFAAVPGRPPEEIADEVSAGARSGRGKFRCMLSDTPIPPAHIKACGRDGRMGSVLLAAVLEGHRERVYIGPQHIVVPHSEHHDIFHDVPCPDISGYFNPSIYGYDSIGKLFSRRQLATLVAFINALQQIGEEVDSLAQDPLYGRAIMTYLTLTLGRLANYNNSFCTWHNGRQCVSHTFAEQGVGMAWDFVEANPFSDSTGSWASMLNYAPQTIASSPCGVGKATQHDAGSQFTECSAPLVSTDPPYFSSITYADFADFFYCIHRECLRSRYPDLYTTLATPKTEEIVAAWHRFGGSRARAGEFFTERLSRALANVNQAADHDSPATVYYAFKQAELKQAGDIGVTAWESMLEVVLSAGFEVVRTWPMRTEYTTTRKSNKNALASSIVIVVRSRPRGASLASRREFVIALKKELPEALRALQSANIAPVDLAQASVGPGMAVFSRYAKVVESDGDSMSVRAALALINQVLDEVLVEQEGDFDADSRWALAWFEQSGFEEGEFGEADVLARAKNTSVQGLVDAGIVVAGRGRVRLLAPRELPDTWNPLKDTRLTTWEMVHHLVRVFDSGGESSAADLVAKLGGNAETARELCYRLYMLCERKKRANEAMSYNALVQSWPEIVRLAREGKKAIPSDSGLFSESEG